MSTNTEWFGGDGAGDSITSEKKHQRSYWKRVGLLFLGAVLLYGIAVEADAQPLASATAGGITVTIHTEACNVPGVSNLKYRATWVEGAKSYEGCWGAHPQYGIVMMYFSDQSVVMLPGEAFQKMTGV